MNSYLNEFEHVINDLKNNPIVNELNNYNQHLNSSRLQHSIDVAYITYKTLKKFNLNEERIINATYAALLHDLFLYDWREIGESSKSHTFNHPVSALNNAKKIIDLNEIQENIILSHMFPLCKELPHSLEAWVVQYADKVSAIKEYAHQSYQITKNTRPISYLSQLFSLKLN